MIFCCSFQKYRQVVACLSSTSRTTLMSKLVLWTTPFSKKFLLDVLNCFSICHSSFSSGRLVCSCWNKVVFLLWICYPPNLLFESSYRQIKLRSTYGNVLIWAMSMQFMWHISRPSWSNEISWLLSPSTTSYFRPCLRRFIWNSGRGIVNLLALTYLVTRHVFSKLEMTFSGPRAIAERCRRGSE